VDVVGKKVESQVQFWSLLGPFFVLLSITVLLFKVSPHWYFPVSALIGIPLCMKWKMKGMAVALTCLFLLAGINYPSLELDDRYWHVGLSLAIAFSFIVLTLALEEVQGLVGKLQLESQSRLDNFLLLDEKWKMAEQEWSLQSERSKNEIATLTQEVAKVQEDKQTFYKLAQLAKDELVQVRGQHEQLLQDLLYKKQQIAQLHERLEETEMTIQGFVNSDAEKQIQTLTERLTYLEREKETFKAKIALAQEEGQTYLTERAHLERELQACQEREKLCMTDRQHNQQERQDQQNAFLSLQGKCALLEQEKHSWSQAQAKWQQQCEQLRHLETQYRQTIEHSQRKIQDLEMKLLEGERQKEALLSRQKQLEEEKYQIESQLKNYQQQLLQQHQQECKDLQERYSKVQESLVKAEQDLEMTQEAFTHLRKKEEHYKTHLCQLQTELEERKKTEKHLKHSVEEEQKTLAEMQEKMSHLSHELSEQQLRFKQVTEQNEKLESLKLQLEQALQEVQVELQKQDSHPLHPGLPAQGHSRRIESMYMQLKEQFQEKCDILDVTRRELFQVNEELLKYRKEYEEEHFFGLSIQERNLQHHLVHLGKQFDRMQETYQREIEDLSQLVGHLLQQMANVR
jgi:chromosome segregation ATPase